MLNTGALHPLAMPTTPGVRLLCACLQFGPPETRRAAENISAAEWPAVIEQARRLGALPLLFWHISRPPVPALELDEPAWLELRRAYLNLVGRNLKLYHRLETILAGLHAAGIPAILLKGAYLAKYVYPDIGLRGMTDVDILIQPHRLAEAAAVLETLGFAPSRPYRLEKEIRAHHHLPPYHAGGLVVELHADLASALHPWTVDRDNLWLRAQALSGPNAFPALGLRPEDLLLHLSLHVLKDEFALGFRRIFDIAQTLEHFKTRLDYPALLARSRAWNLEKGLFLCLYLAQALFHAPVDPNSLHALEPADFTPEVAALALQRTLALSDPQKPHLGDAGVHPLVARLGRKQPLGQKLRRIKTALLPYPEFVAHKYGLQPGAKWVYFYYPWRWAQMLAASAGQFWRIARGERAAADAAYTENLLSDWCMSQNQRG